MKHKHIIALGFTSLLAFGSCGEDFLYKSPQGSIDEGQLTTPDGVELLVVNAYANLTEEDWGASVFNWALSGMYGGDANKGSDPGDQSVLNEMELYNTMSTNGYLNEKWRWTYKGVKRVNKALNVMANVPEISEEKRKMRTAELVFLRTLFYFESIKVFSPFIPYYDETAAENNPLVGNERDIYEDVLRDIDKAIADLPNRQTEEIGRINVWAAKALKAKMLMQKGDMAAAKPIWKDVLDNGVTNKTGQSFGLIDNMSDNWNSSNDNNSRESIYEIQFSVDANNNGNVSMALCYPHNSGPGGCCGFYQPSYELVNSYQVDEKGLPYLNAEYRTKPSVTTKDEDKVSVNNDGIAVDPRLDFAVGRLGVPYKDWGLPATDWIRNPVNGGVFLPKKHVYSKAESDAGLGGKSFSLGWAPGSAMNIQYLSVRDAMLSYAECLANDGDLKGAMDLVNQIRKRASLDVNITKTSEGKPAANYKVTEYPSSHAAFSDKNTCIKAVRMERKLELAMEGHRWFDLVRWGGDYMAKELKSYVDYEKQYIPKFAGASYLPASRTMFPVPDEQMNLMGEDPSGKPYLTQPAAWK